jgi:hypothetical protein
MKKNSKYNRKTWSKTEKPWIVANEWGFVSSHSSREQAVRTAASHREGRVVGPERMDVLERQVINQKIKNKLRSESEKASKMAKKKKLFVDLNFVSNVCDYTHAVYLPHNPYGP